jgi:DNA-binding IscR family transcriptional regulator
VDVSPKIALRDLKELVDARFLTAKGEKRGRYYVASDATRMAVRNVARPGKVDDPYEVVEKTGPVLPGMESYLLG